MLKGSGNSGVGGKEMTIKRTVRGDMGRVLPDFLLKPARVRAAGPSLLCTIPAPATSSWERSLLACLQLWEAHHLKQL